MERKERRKAYLVDITTDDGGMYHLMYLDKKEVNLLKEISYLSQRDKIGNLPYLKLYKYDEVTKEREEVEVMSNGSKSK
jgi:hypothetical protein